MAKLRPGAGFSRLRSSQEESLTIIQDIGHISFLRKDRVRPIWY